MTKRWQDSYTEQVQILMPEHINGANRLFGGKLLAWIDVVAAVTARRHSGYDVTTACVDHLQFLAPAHMNDTVLLTGRVTWTGRTSMEVRVDTYTETKGIRKLVNRAYLVMVAIDENENPAPVPSLLVETQEDRIEWQEAEKRKQERSKKRAET